MPRYEWLQQDRCDKRRSVADAIEVLLQHGGFDSGLAVQIRVGGLRLPSEEIVGLVAVFAESVAAETTFIVTLPSAREFQAKPQGSQEIESFDIFRLDGATVDGIGAVKLTDGARVRAVEVTPALLPATVTDLDWRIVHLTIELIQAEQECYRSPFPELLPVLDCGTLPALSGRIPPLKVIQGHIADREPEHRKPSVQAIADTLRKFGMRIPAARPRRARAASAT